MFWSNLILTTVVKFGMQLVETSLNGLQELHNRCARIIMNFKDELGQSQLALDRLGWISVEETRKHIMARLMFNLRLSIIWNRRGSRTSMFQNSNHIHSYLFTKLKFVSFLQRPNTEYGGKYFRYTGVKIWSTIPEQVRNSESLNSFNRNISSLICFVICILYS